MSEYAAIRRLRPQLFSGFRRFAQPFPLRSIAIQPTPSTKKVEKTGATHDFERRVTHLQSIGPEAEWYPRLSPGFAASRSSIKKFLHNHDHLIPKQTEVDKTVVVAGKIRSVRTAGGKLVFLDLQDNGCRVQVVCSFERLADADDEITLSQFKRFMKMARKGDAFSVAGSPHRTQTGQLSVLATSLPTLLSPSLHQIPEHLEDAEARARNRHVDMLVNEQAKTSLLARHHIEATLQEFFNRKGFTKVNTPIINSIAGGATARPFRTSATELADEQLNLRIAPELWLKRLVVGGLERVYEIGPAFRNEGVDLTHNPEFSICEFYEAYATLEDLMVRTQELFAAFKEVFKQLRESQESSPDGAIKLLLPEPDPILKQPFATIEFIPKLEELLATKLPDLETDDASDKILALLGAHSIEIPSDPTLPRLLDALSSALLEPLSHARPTFITHHPACMSPLSKHFVCPSTSQVVAARAELFLAGREYANMYEEENSPFEQRRKFEAQERLRRVDAEAMPPDESYLRALEWALPPTGGWGCGVDRLVMLFAGCERMADVLAFGTLRNVVGLGKVVRS